MDDKWSCLDVRWQDGSLRKDNERDLRGTVKETMTGLGEKFNAEVMMKYSNVT